MGRMSSKEEVFKGELYEFYDKTDLEKTKKGEFLIWKPFESVEKNVIFKRYKRSAAGQERPHPSQVRPPHVLFPCTIQLIQISLEHLFSFNFHVLDFFLNRFRAIKQDLIVQSEWISLDDKCQEYYQKILVTSSKFLIFLLYFYLHFVFQVEFQDSLKFLYDMLVGNFKDLQSKECLVYQSILWFKPCPNLKICRFFQHDLFYNVFQEYDKCTSVLVKCCIAMKMIPIMRMKTLQNLNVALNGSLTFEILRKLLKCQDDKEMLPWIEFTGLPIDYEHKVVIFKKSQKLNQEILDEISSQPSWKLPKFQFRIPLDKDLIMREVFEAV
jgi:hypothetical protein